MYNIITHKNPAFALWHKQRIKHYVTHAFAILCVCAAFFTLSLLSFVGSFLFFTFTSFQLSDATICAIFASYISSVLLVFLSLPASSGFFFKFKTEKFHEGIEWADDSDDEQVDR